MLKEMQISETQAGSLPPVIVHMGYVRTSTTMHQRHVFPGHEKMLFVGQPFSDMRVKSAVKALIRCDSATYEPEATRECLMTAVRPAVAQGASSILISDERMLTPESVDISILVERLRDLFGGLKVLLTIRSQFDLFRSWCTHVLNKDNFGAIETIVEQHSRLRGSRSTTAAFLNYARYYDVLECAIGPDNVLVLPYELLRADRKRYSQLLGGFVGIPAETIEHRIATAPVENKNAAPHVIAF
jgi:hypothetical protein